MDSQTDCVNWWGFSQPSWWCQSQYYSVQSSLSRLTNLHWNSTVLIHCPYWVGHHSYKSSPRDHLFKFVYSTRTDMSRSATCGVNDTPVKQRWPHVHVVCRSNMHCLSTDDRQISRWYRASTLGNWCEKFLCPREKQRCCSQMSSWLSAISVGHTSINWNSMCDFSCFLFLSYTTYFWSHDNVSDHTKKKFRKTKPLSKSHCPSMYVIDPIGTVFSRLSPIGLMMGDLPLTKSLHCKLSLFYHDTYPVTRGVVKWCHVTVTWSLHPHKHPKRLPWREQWWRDLVTRCLNANPCIYLQWYTDKRYHRHCWRRNTHSKS